jgi:hypothetical protein
MDLSWVSPALVGLGVVANFALGLRRDAKREGRRDERMDAHEKRLNSHSAQLTDLRADVGEQAEKIAKIQGHLNLA